MTVRRISSFGGAHTADELLSLSTPKLAEIVLQQCRISLQDCGGARINALQEYIDRNPALTL